MKFFRSTEHLKDEENKSLNWSVLRKVLKNVLIIIKMNTNEIGFI